MKQYTKNIKKMLKFRNDMKFHYQSVYMFLPGPQTSVNGNAPIDKDYFSRCKS